MSMKKQDERKKNWEKIRDVKIEKLTIAEKVVCVCECIMCDTLFRKRE